MSAKSFSIQHPPNAFPKTIYIQGNDNGVGPGCIDWQAPNDKWFAKAVDRSKDALRDMLKKGGFTIHFISNPEPISNNVNNYQTLCNGAHKTKYRVIISSPKLAAGDIEGCNNMLSSIRVGIPCPVVLVGDWTEDVSKSALIPTPKPMKRKNNKAASLSKSKLEALMRDGGNGRRRAERVSIMGRPEGRDDDGKSKDEQIERLHHTVHDREQQLEKRTSELSDMSDIHREEMVRGDKLEQQLKVWESKVVELEKTVADTQATKDNLKSIVEKQANDVNTIKEENEQLRQDKKRLEEENIAMMNRMVSLEKQMAELRLSQSKYSVDDHGERMVCASAAEKVIQKLTNEIDVLRRQRRIPNCQRTSVEASIMMQSEVVSQHQVAYHVHPTLSSSRLNAGDRDLIGTICRVMDGVGMVTGQDTQYHSSSSGVQPSSSDGSVAPFPLGKENINRQSSQLRRTLDARKKQA